LLKEASGSVQQNKEHLDYLVRRGVSTNVASFVGATTVRIHEIGYADRRPTPDELDRMCRLVRQAMEEGIKSGMGPVLNTASCVPMEAFTG
jgi:N-acyl-D-aspartate/D-glutamate deacylase